MRIVAKDLKRGVLKVVPETIDDLWLLSMVITPGDIVRAKTVREVRFGERGSGRSARVPMVLSVKVEHVEFQSFTTRLRVRGIVVEGPEKFGVLGKRHTINVDLGTEVTIIKEGGWPRQLLERLEKSTMHPPVVVVSVDYDEYAVAVVRSQGVRVLREGSSNLPGKDDPRREEAVKGYITTITRSVIEVTKSSDAEIVVVAGPGALKELVVERLRSEAPKLKIYLDSTSMGGVAGVYEVLRRGTLRKILGEVVVVEAERVIGEFERLLIKEPARAAYGLEAVKKAAELGAVKEVILVDEAVYSFDADTRRLALEILELCDACRARVHIVPASTPAGLKVKALGGALAILRYPAMQQDNP